MIDIQMQWQTFLKKGSYTMKAVPERDVRQQLSAPSRCVMANWPAVHHVACSANVSALHRHRVQLSSQLMHTCLVLTRLHLAFLSGQTVGCSSLPWLPLG